MRASATGPELLRDNQGNVPVRTLHLGRGHKKTRSTNIFYRAKRYLYILTRPFGISSVYLSIVAYRNMHISVKWLTRYDRTAQIVRKCKPQLDSEDRPSTILIAALCFRIGRNLNSRFMFEKEIYSCEKCQRIF